MTFWRYVSFFALGFPEPTAGQCCVDRRASIHIQIDGQGPSEALAHPEGGSRAGLPGSGLQQPQPLLQLSLTELPALAPGGELQPHALRDLDHAKFESRDAPSAAQLRVTCR